MEKLSRGGIVNKGTGSLVAYLLILVGTLGLLGNEFWFDWGRTATLIFAGANAVGLLGLTMSLFGGRKS